MIIKNRLIGKKELLALQTNYNCVLVIYIFALLSFDENKLFCKHVHVSILKNNRFKY